MVRRVAGRAAVLSVVAFGFAGCGTTATGDLAATTDVGGVTVRAAWSPVGNKVVVTLRPDAAGFHVYSLDLPADGIDGIGIPTNVRVGGRLTQTGPARANRPVRQLHYAALGIDLPVYPDGTVSISVPVASRGSTPAVVIVSFAACSDARCDVPVRDSRLELT